MSESAALDAQSLREISTEQAMARVVEYRFAAEGERSVYQSGAQRRFDRRAASRDRAARLRRHARGGRCASSATSRRSPG